MKGRKRHILVDHCGFLIAGVISAGNCSDRDGLEALLNFHYRKKKLPKKVFADQEYSGINIKQRVARYGVDLETIKKREGKGFILEARRWIVERTFAWLGKFRRLSKDYELILSSSLSMIYIAMTRIMITRLGCLS